MTKNVVIAGAGPAGLLLVALLIQRNRELETPLYNIILLDNRQNLAQFTDEELKKSFRSWMLGLANHGCDAIRECTDGLYTEFVRPVGIQIEELSIHIGTKEFNTASSNKNDAPKADVPEALIIDRNFAVASLSRYVDKKIKENNSKSNGICTTYYEHQLLYVDYDNRRLLIRPKNNVENEDFYISYDLLVGCDGIRSCVREAIVKRHSTFEMDIGDIFNQFKAVHIERPECVREASLHILPGCIPEFQGIALPETGNKINLSMGIPRCNFHKVPTELLSTDIEVVANYMKQNFKAFTLIDYNDFAQQWINQQWNRTGQVHCNFYHSIELGIVLMGDACHATSPSIGMGMNTALRDAQTLYLLLKENNDDFDVVLPKYSQLRVKEGNSLSDLALNLYCFDQTAQLIETMHQVIRAFLHKLFPSLIWDHPANLIGVTGYDLSDCYERAVQLGIITKHRRINDRMRRTFFEQECGMVKSKPKNTLSITLIATIILSLGVGIVAVLHTKTALTK